MLFKAPSVCSSTDRASDYGSEGWGFESLQAHFVSSNEGWLSKGVLEALPLLLTASRPASLRQQQCFDP